MRYVLVIAFAAVSAVAAPRPLTTCANASDCRVTGTLLLRSGNAVKKVALSGGVAEVGSDVANWQATLDADGFWMPQQPFDPQQPLRVWKTAPLRGRFALAEQDTMPKAVTVSADLPGITGAGFTCPVDAGGAWSCAVPAMTLDLVIRAKTFTPHYLFNAKIPGDLGVVTLRHGASVAAWLDSRTAKSLAKPARARLMRMTMAMSPDLGDKLTAPVAEAAFNARGLVQLAPLAPGTYSLEVTAPGFAPAIVDRIDVFANAESKLRNVIKLDPPLPIRFTFDPPRDPAGRSWHVTVDRRSEYTFRSTSVASAVTDAAGRVNVNGQAVGHYTVIVTDSRDNRYVWRELDIRGEQDAEQTIDIPVLRLHGKVTAASEPIPAHLLFGGQSGSERIRVDADNDGTFTVTLPRAGKWRVDVDDAASGIHTAVTTNVDERHDSLQIDLPSTEIRGWVRGTDGKRVAGANVLLSNDDGVITRRSEADGTFRFRGVRAGPATLNAADPRTREYSRFVTITAAEGAHVENIELALQETLTFKGMVTSQGQPLIGARVTGYGFGGGPALQQRAVTGLDGGFELSFPAAASQLSLLVAAPGRALQAFAMPPTDRPVTLEVAASGGTLRLHLGGASRTWLTSQGALISMPDIIDWTRAHDPTALASETWSVPAMAPGPYRFCIAKRDGAAQVCRDGVLAPGGVLDLAPQ
ncbi:MAG TPA: carboxypeptidase-like regulatory domain-containing protein [Thermoanaerobaculia bacterium]|nr:carboxypeptidase-like regulatory domain-containing protein [Thermoanaerobaculia bacterium]